MSDVLNSLPELLNAPVVIGHSERLGKLLAIQPEDDVKVALKTEQTGTGTDATRSRR